MKIFLILSLAWIGFVKADSTDTQFFNTQSEYYRGQSLVIHGLNMKPEKMADIISELNLRGYDALLLKLYGHNNDLEKMKNVTCEDWENQVFNAFKEISRLNVLKGGEIILTGFSIGAVLPLEFLMRKSEFKVDRAILFAPALSLNTSSYLINFFNIFGGGFIVPSFSPKEYRAQEGASMAAYRCLFQTVEKFEKVDSHKFTFSTLIFIDPDDELVSYREIKNLSKKFRNSKVIDLDNSKSSLPKPNHHLIIDKLSLGLNEWNKKVVTSLDDFLGK